MEKIKKGTPHARFPSCWFDLKNDLAGSVQSLVEILVRVDKGDHARLVAGRRKVDAVSAHLLVERGENIGYIIAFLNGWTETEAKLEPEKTYTTAEMKELFDLLYDILTKHIYRN